MSPTVTAPAPGTSRLLMPRLIALWALSEVLLGGVLHALKIQVTGLVVGGAAVVLLQLLSHYARRPGTVLRGLLVVLTIKALLSPQSPPTAYVAVAFQGLMAELLSWGKALPRLRGALLGFITMLESAGQRVLMLWLMFGNELPQAFNEFVQQQVGRVSGNSPDYALLLIGLYFGVHALVGAGLGWWAGGLPRRLPYLSQHYPWLRLPEPDIDPKPVAVNPQGKKRGWRVNRLLLGIWLLLLVAWLAALAGWAPATALQHHRIGGLLLRSALVYGGWALLVAPLLTGWLRRWLTRPRGRWAADLQATLELLPATRQLVAQCWRLSAGYRGLPRLRWFWRALAVNLFTDPAPAPAAYVTPA